VALGAGAVGVFDAVNCGIEGSGSECRGAHVGRPPVLLDDFASLCDTNSSNAPPSATSRRDATQTRDRVRRRRPDPLPQCRSSPAPGRRAAAAKKHHNVARAKQRAPCPTFPANDAATVVGGAHARADGDTVRTGGVRLSAVAV